MKTSPSATSPPADLESVELPNEMLARLAVHSAKTGQPVDAIIRAATEELLVKLESDLSSAPASAPVADSEGAMSDALSELEVKIELLKTCGEELLAKVGGLTLTLTEDAVSSVAFFFGPMHEAFSKQLREAFAVVHRLAIQAKRSSANQPTPSPAIESKPALLEDLFRRARLMEETLNDLSIVCESVNTATGVADEEDGSDFSAMANWASGELKKRAEAATKLAVENRRHLDQALAFCKTIAT